MDTKIGALIWGDGCIKVTKQLELYYALKRWRVALMMSIVSSSRDEWLGVRGIWYGWITPEKQGPFGPYEQAPQDGLRHAKGCKTPVRSW
jgi:hypothetical protein